MNDLYRDGTTFVQTLEEGKTGNTASPFNDCKVLIQVQVSIDGEQIFSNMGDTPLLYDLEEFEMPSVVKRVLKQTKLNELVQIDSTKSIKLLDHLPDKHQVFVHSKLSQFKDKVTILVKLVEILQKPHLFKVVINEKVERLDFLAAVAQRYIELEPVSIPLGLNHLKKAEKMYLRIQRYYRNKDAMNNFLEEDTQTLDYRNALDAIEAIHSANFCNYSSLLLKQNKTNLALEKINEGLQKIDHRDYQSNLLKVKILCTQNKYAEAKEILADLSKWHPDNSSEIDQRLAQVVKEEQTQAQQEKEVYQNMFGQQRDATE